MRVTNDRKILRECPLCGGVVELDRDDPLVADSLLEEGPDGGIGEGGPVDRLITAVCGCYVFRMDDNAVGRLMAAVLGAKADSDGPGAD